MFKDFLRFFWQKILLPACGFFTLFLILISLASSFSSPNEIPAIPLSQAMVILLFSFVFSALNRILYVKSLHPFIRVGIHFLASIASLVVILLCLSGFYSTNGMDSTLFLTFFFVGLYVFVLILALILHACGVPFLRLPMEEDKDAKKTRTK